MWGKMWGVVEENVWGGSVGDMFPINNLTIRRKRLWDQSQLESQ